MFRIQKRILEIAKRLQETEPNREHKFLEVGANDGVIQNNSLQLEELGWDGILIEPSLIAFKALDARRNCSHKFNCAIGDGSIDFIHGTFNTGSLMSSCDPEIVGKKTWIKSILKSILFKVFPWNEKFRPLLTKVQVRTLSNLIEVSKIDLIDIMVLDIEGYEISAIKGLNSKYDPRIMVIETRKRDAFEINDLMLGKGYVLFENLSKFTTASDPSWSKDHQDYLWVKHSDENALICASS